MKIWTFRARASVLLLALLASTASAQKKQVNDEMFPPAPAAQAAICIDGKGFTIHGERKYIASGSIHYPRVPRDLWRDRLLRAQRAGFNTVETYAFWNYHEPRENAWDFTGEKDFAAFLRQAQEVGMYATVRVGPYVCAEWDSGGYPVWLKFKPNLVVRSDNPAYLTFNDRWYDKILRLTAAHQIHRGGNVILVQLENEHPLGWGAVTPNPYFKHLYAKALELGVEVPFFMSGLNHGHGPTPRTPDNSGRKSPWFTTEFWPGWYDLYGPLPPGRFRQVERDNWLILARGGNGHNFYMLHGGSNFETWNDDSGAASYDYGAAIGQAGDLRPIYYRMKRANLFAMSFPAILEDSTDASAKYQDYATGAALAGARHSPAGTIVFLQNQTDKPAVAHLKSGTAIKLHPGEIAPLVLDTPVADGVKVVEAARILGVAHHDKTTTIVVHGPAGDAGRVQLAFAGEVKVAGPSAAWAVDQADARRPVVRGNFPQAGPEEVVFTSGGQTIRLLAVSTALADRTWVVGADRQQYVVCGPEFVGDFRAADDKVSLTIERPYGHPSCGKVIVYGARQPLHLAVKANDSVDAAAVPALEHWQMRLAAEAAPGFDDVKWKTSADPEQMGADGDTSAFAWYRAEVEAKQAGAATVHFAGGADHLLLFVNGMACRGERRSTTVKTKTGERKQPADDWTFNADLKAGRNTLAVLTSHAGRDKAFNYLGSLENFHRKGLFAPVYIEIAGRPVEVKGWKMRGGVGEVDGTDSRWQVVAPTEGVPAFYRATFAAKPPAGAGAHPILRATFKGLSRGTMWLNGRNLGRYPEKLHLDGLYLPECWLKDGSNTLVVFDEQGASGPQVKLYVETAASREVIQVADPCDPATPLVVP